MGAKAFNFVTVPSPLHLYLLPLLKNSDFILHLRHIAKAQKTVHSAFSDSSEILSTKQ